MSYCFQEASPQLIKMNDVDMIMEDSLDGGPPSVGSGEIPVLVQTPGPPASSTPASSKKVKVMQTFYLLITLISIYTEVSNMFNSCMNFG